MEFGENGAVLSDVDTVSTPRGIRRNKTAVIVSSLSAIVAVSLIGWIGIFLVNVIGIFSIQEFSPNASGAASELGEAISFALFLSGLNFFVLPVSLPIILTVIGGTVGRYIHAGKTARRDYVRTMVIIGSVLVGGTCLIFPAFAGVASGPAGLLSLLVVAFVGVGIGALAGLAVGYLFYMILRPDRQLYDIQEREVSVFD